MDVCNVLKPLPEFAQLSSLRHMGLDQRSHCEGCSIGGPCTSPSPDFQRDIHNEVYPDDGLDPSSDDYGKKNPLVWGEDILFLDQHHNVRHRGEHHSDHRETVGDESDRMTQQADMSTTAGKFEMTVTSMCELNEMSVMSEPDKYNITLPGYGAFLPTKVEDLDGICNSLQLGGLGMEAADEGCTLEEVQQPGTPTEEPSPPPPVGRPGLRRTRNASRRLSVMVDDASYCSQSESVSGRRRNSSEHSIVSTGSCYDDPDSPYGNSNSNGNGKRKRRRYEEEPSDNPAFEKSRKNAIIAKRNREKKKQLMEQMELQCEKLTTQNDQLGSENGKLRLRVQTLEEEVSYLKNVLANQSALANVLSSLDVKNHDQLRFSTSFDATRYKKVGSSASSGGVCLHVDGNQVSMELCSICAKYARGSGRK